MPRRNALPHYQERENKDGSLSRFVYPTIGGKPCWRKIPADGQWAGVRGYRRYLAKVIEEETNKAHHSNTLFSEVATAWLAERHKTRSAGTVALDGKNIRVVLLPRFGSRPWYEIRRRDIQGMIFDLVPRQYQRSTVQITVLKTLRQIIKWQSLREEVPYDSQLFAGLEYPRTNPSKEEKRKGRALTPEEIGALLEAIPYHHRSLIQIMVLTGLRIGEALAMEWKHYAKEEGKTSTGYYRVERTLNHRQEMVNPKTPGSKATLRLGSQAVAILERHRAEQAQLRLQYPGWIDQGDPLIFPTQPTFTGEGTSVLSPRRQPDQLGRCQYSDNVRKAIQRAAANAGLGKVNPHDFRHTHASKLISEGCNIKAVSHRLRHTSIQTTLDIYGHLYLDDQQEVADIADRAFNFG